MVVMLADVDHFLSQLSLTPNNCFALKRMNFTSRMILKTPLATFVRW